MQRRGYSRFKNCHKEKGRKSPYEYKEELRIRTKLNSIQGLKDLHPSAKQSSFSIDAANENIELNGRTYPLFSQQLNGLDHWYFFAEIATEFIENDDQIQLRPLDSRIIALTFSLRNNLQLLPSLARLETSERKIKVFDGQHKAVAQIVGNNRKKIACIVFVDPDVDSLRQTVTEAHSTFVQQRYAPSHIDRKLADIYASRIKEIQHGDPTFPYSEVDILRHEPKAAKHQFLLASIIDGLRDEGDFIGRYVYEPRGRAKDKPIPYKDLEVIVETFANLEPVSKPSGDPENYRSSELKNLYFILTCLEKHSLKDKWDPLNQASITAQLPNLSYQTHPLKVWVEIYEKAIRHALENMFNRAIREPLCYSREFTPEIKNRIDKITERLFIHGLWLNVANQPTLRSIYDEDIRKLFDKERLDYIYLTNLD